MVTRPEEIRVERTGEIFSIASSQFRVTYPDGHVGTIWSPPWHELDDAAEEAAARAKAAEWFDAGTHKSEHSANDE